MFEIGEKEILKRLRFDNPWWDGVDAVDPVIDAYPRRAYLDEFFRLATNPDIRRAVVLMGPRRVGKTILLKHSIYRLLADGVEGTRILFVSVDSPTYTGIPLERMLEMFMESHGHGRYERLYVIYDEIQYLKDWEVHLKSMVDSYPNIKLIVSGSAAAALRLKGRESGAGRFTDFLLPPLTFGEFLMFRDFDGEKAVKQGDWTALNAQFVDYINFGGFPEPVLSEGIRSDTQRFLANDIIEKVLMRDLPNLYGIDDSRELNKLFGMLAYNTGGEMSYEDLSQASGVAKNTIRKHIEYLEAAFLIHRLRRIDDTGRHFKREMTFKVYLTNPCLRAALFGPVEDGDPAMGRLVETALLAQMVHFGDVDSLYYARGKIEVDFVVLDRGTQKPINAIEVKWSDRWTHDTSETKPLREFMAKTGTFAGVLLTKSTTGIVCDGDYRIVAAPVANYCLFMAKGVDLALANGNHPRRLFKDLLGQGAGPSPASGEREGAEPPPR